MTERDIIERGEIYRELIKSPGWELLLSEVGAIINSNTSSIIERSDHPMFAERGIVKGMTQVLKIPSDAIDEAVRVVNKETDQA